ncbi:MAG: 30S ribosomal protein S17 [Planctomycetota bacterium]|jgi:small subunit ribosomal protein S17
MTQEPAGQRKRARGVVKSDKMDQTVTVIVERLVRDRRYGKYVRRKNTFMVHNPHNVAREGDQVEIESTRPLSRRKRWRLVRVLRRAPGSVATSPEVQQSGPGATA